MNSRKIQLLLLSGFMICQTILQGQAQPGPSSPFGTLSPGTGLLLKDDAVMRLIQTSSGDQAFDYVSQLALWDREQVSEGFARAADWVVQKASESGLEQVIIEHFPCDGRIEYFGQVIDPQWKVRKGELWLTSPFSMKLTSYDDLPMSLVFASVSSDVEAELVDIGRGTDDNDYAAGVRGKIVLTTSRPSDVYERAVTREGAAGIVSSWSVPDFDYYNRRPGDFPDQVGWSAIPWEKSGDKSCFAFLISSRHAQDLQVWMRQGKALRVHAVVDAELVPGNLEVVSGLIPGSIYPNEEIIVTAHLDHYKPGANDNASGSAAILEMARTMKELIDNKVLPQPLRTIRFMWVPEYYGTYAWLSVHLNDPVKRIANLNFDMVGENTVKTNSILRVNYTSDSNPSFLNAVMESIVDFANRYNSERYPSRMDLYIGSVKGSRDRLECRMEPYTTGTDHELFNNLKIAAATLGAWPDNFYHSSEDTPDKVDPTQLHRAIVIGLAGLTTLAYADDGNARDIARLSLIYSRKRIAASEFSAVKSLLAADKYNFDEADHLAVNLITHVYRRELSAIGSTTLFAKTSSTENNINKTVALLKSEEAISQKKVEDIAAQRATELGVTRVKRSLTEAEKKATKLIPIPNYGKELFNLSCVSRILATDSTARIKEIMSFMEDFTRQLLDQGESELRVFSIPDAPAFYADGKRSILEIRDAFTAEYGPISIEMLGLYFRAFEEAGVMQILKK
jgi:hypothetical protein